MSSEQHNSAQSAGEPVVHKDVAFESRDINTRTILTYLSYLAIAVAGTFLITVFIFRFTSKMATASDRTLPPAHQGVGPTIPPGPLLQGIPLSPDDPQQDLRNKMAADEKANETLGWTDRSAGIAQIPVADAMKIVVSKGLASGLAPAEKKK